MFLWKVYIFCKSGREKHRPKKALFTLVQGLEEEILPFRPLVHNEVTIFIHFKESITFASILILLFF